jgi:hypothetical protein
MVIFVETWRQTLVLEIEQADTIAIVKSKIQDREGLARERQRIFLDDRELDDGVRVGAILVQDDLCLNLGDDFEINIASGETLAVSIKASQTVRSIKEHIHIKTGVSPDRQLLVLGETVLLQDDRRFGAYLTQEDVTCHPQIVQMISALTD